ncbi:MAG: hypothetical protein EXS63_01890 [Candidatus Omnitrophica bacterium]|nr:hypothetical protein [Candidatus Omnitrophota bacterium]
MKTPASSSQRLVFLNVAGEDRPGIIASVTRILFNHGGNLEDASMTLLDGKFAMMMVFTLSTAKLDAFKKAAGLFEKSENLSCFLKEFPASPSSKHHQCKASQEANYLISVIGPDQTGIVYKLSRILASQGLNITDLNCKVLEASSGNLYSLMLETFLPSKAIAAVLEKKLKTLALLLQIEIRLKPIEILDFS